MEKYFKNLYGNKRLFVSAICSLLFTAFFLVSAKALFLQNEFDRTLYSNVVRLHIIADDDSQYAQNAKIEIRDAILPFLSELTKDVADAGEAEKILRSNISHIDSQLKFIISDLGYPYESIIQLTEEYYPVRRYGMFTFPSGTYTSLKICLGQAGGKNFWCIIYPSVCNEISCKKETVKEKLSDAGVSDNAVKVICNDNPIDFDFYFLEFVQNFCKHIKQ